MDFFFLRLNSLRRIGAVLAFAGALLAASSVPAAASAEPHAQSLSSRNSLRAPEDRPALVRKGIVAQAALAPIPNRSKDKAGSKDKSAWRTLLDNEVTFASSSAPALAIRVCVGHTHSWAWTSRAPPQIPA